ncbi:2'-5' RNA ligase [Lachnospiraceae bacterium NE2001]|nr:2'-5' RNA ligase [Lachnospiraceae bacterium NE2001]
MRLFIAINFDKEIIYSLKRVQGDLKKCGLEGRYTKEENLHLTLAFIGEYGNPDDVLDALEELEFTPFEISLSGFGSFGDLYWVGLEENPHLKSLVKRLRKSLSDSQIPFDKKKFSPHITLVRKGVFMKGKKSFPQHLPEMKMTVRSISLMRSDFGKNGVNYTVVGEVGE